MQPRGNRYPSQTRFHSGRDVTVHRLTKYVSQVPTSLYGLLRIPVAPRSFYPSTIPGKKAVSNSESASK